MDGFFHSQLAPRPAAPDLLGGRETARADDHTARGRVEQERSVEGDAPADAGEPFVAAMDRDDLAIEAAPGPLPRQQGSRVRGRHRQQRDRNL